MNPSQALELPQSSVGFQPHPLQSVTLGEHFATQSLSFLVCEMGTMRPPHNGWEDSVSKQGYKKLRGLIINTGIFALSEHI